MNRNYLLFSFLISLIFIEPLQAQTFDETLNKIPREQRSQNQFKLFKPRLLTDSTMQKNYFGLRVGANLSNFAGDAEGTSNMVGLKIGAVYSRMLSNRTVLQFEVAYTKQGAQQDESTLQTGILLDSGLTIATRQNYIGIPLSIKYYPSMDLGLFLEAGVRAAFLLNAELQGADGVYSNFSDGRIDVEEGLNSFDAGTLLGIGFSFHKNVDFNIRYHYMFTNYINTSSSLTVDEGNYRNSLLQASLAFYLK